MPLSLLNDSTRDATARWFARLESENVLERVKALDERARNEGLSALPPDDELVRLGMEIDVNGNITKNSYGVLNLAWQAAQHPEWPGVIESEIEEIRGAVRTAHGVNIRFVIWAGMGGSIEDKTAYNACGLLKGGPQFYSLDSTDPAKLQAIVADMERRASQPINTLLPATLVVGMAMGMTSYEPVVNLEKIAGMYEKFGIDSRANFIYMTLPGSVLDRFAQPRGYKRVPLQPDNANSSAGRHSAPLTRGSLYPLALAGRDLAGWIDAAILNGEEIAEAFRLAAFLHAQGEAGRDKVVFLPPRSWLGAALWTKQDVEESLGKSEEIGIKIVIGDNANLKSRRKPEDPKQDQVFLAVQIKTEDHPHGAAIGHVRHAGYPLAIVTFPRSAQLSAYMQFMHHVVFALGYLRKMNFVTQPSVELYKSVAAEIHQRGSLTSPQWQALASGKRWHANIYGESPESLAKAIRDAVTKGAVEYGEVTFFGDLRYGDAGKALRKVLESGAEKLFRSKLKMPVDVYEGPAMNHSYHEMIIGRGKCFSVVIASREQAHYRTANYGPDYHVAQFLATRIALDRRHRQVRAILVKDLSPESMGILEEFFAATAAAM